MPYKLKLSEETDPLRIEKRREKSRRTNRNWRLKHSKEESYIAKKRKDAKEYNKRIIGKYKNNSRNKLRYYISVGKIIKKPCELCGDKNSQGHHPDHSKPLDVVWLCPRHHGIVHRKNC